MMHALHYTMDNILVHSCHAGLYPETEDALSAALKSKSFVNFTILLEKPTTIKVLYLSMQKHPQLKFLAAGLLCIIFYNYTIFW